MEQKQIYAIYDKKHKNKVVALMNALNIRNCIFLMDLQTLRQNNIQLMQKLRIRMGLLL